MNLIAPKPIREFSPDDYHRYVTEMYFIKVSKKKSIVLGISLRKTKKGNLSVRRTKDRAFSYITLSEISELSKEHGVSQAELWNMFKAKAYIISSNRMEAEKIYAKLKGLPW